MNAEKMFEVAPVSSAVKAWRKEHERRLKMDPIYREKYEKLERDILAAFNEGTGASTDLDGCFG